MKKRYRVSGTQPLEIPRGSGIFRDPGWEGEADSKGMEFYVQIGAAEEAKGTNGVKRGAKKAARKTAAPRAAKTTRVAKRRVAFDTTEPNTGE